MKVYYNESCNICRVEVNLYKKQNIKEIEWIDITNNIDAEKNTSKDDKTLLRRLHVEEGGTTTIFPSTSDKRIVPGSLYILSLAFISFCLGNN